MDRHRTALQGWEVGQNSEHVAAVEGRGQRYALDAVAPPVALGALAGYSCQQATRGPRVPRRDLARRLHPVRGRPGFEGGQHPGVPAPERRRQPAGPFEQCRPRRAAHRAARSRWSSTACFTRVSCVLCIEPAATLRSQWYARTGHPSGQAIRRPPVVPTCDTRSSEL